MKGTIRIDRLENLLAHMRSDKVIHKEFDYSYYNKGAAQEDADVLGCGTSGCMMGEMPAVDPEFAFTTMRNQIEVGEVFNHSLVFLFRDAKGYRKNIEEELLKLNWFNYELADEFISTMEGHDLFNEENPTQLRPIYMHDASEMDILPALSGMYYFGMTSDEYGHVFIPSAQKHKFLLEGQSINKLFGSATLEEVLDNLEQFIAWAKVAGRAYTGE